MDFSTRRGVDVSQVNQKRATGSVCPLQQAKGWETALRVACLSQMKFKKGTIMQIEKNVAKMDHVAED